MKKLVFLTIAALALAGNKSEWPVEIPATILIIILIGQREILKLILNHPELN